MRRAPSAFWPDPGDQQADEAAEHDAAHGREPVDLGPRERHERQQDEDHRGAEHVGVVVVAVAAAPALVSVKGKSNEGVDAVGRGEAIAAQAVALVRGGR